MRVFVATLIAAGLLAACAPLPPDEQLPSLPPVATPDMASQDI